MINDDVLSAEFIERNLVNHPPSGQTQTFMEEVRRDYHTVVRQLFGLVPYSRERSLALTKLEESLMWAMAALARDDWDSDISTDY